MRVCDTIERDGYIGFTVLRLGAALLNHLGAAADLLGRRVQLYGAYIAGC